jgi:hypothetical protein
VADIGTMTGTPPAEQQSDSGGRRVRRARSLPGGRAVVGALLITAAAVATFAAYLQATAEPTTSYLVALDTIEPGTRFETVDELTAVMGSITIELTEPLTGRAIPVGEVDDFVGRVLVAPLQRGDLVTRTALVDDGGVAPAQTLSFALPRTAAVAGTLRPGERIDVLATFSATGGEPYTAYVSRGVPLLHITAPDGGPLGASGDVLLTVAITELVDVQALGHAVNTAEVFVTRSTASPGDLDEAPGAFLPDQGAPGPRPEGATSISPGLGAPDEVPGDPDADDTGGDDGAEDDAVVDDEPGVEADDQDVG